MGTPVGIVIHGGASESWIGDDASYAATKTFLNHLVAKAEQRLRQGAEAVDVATEVVAELEDFPEFNAGRGAAVNREGLHELEAGIINGKTAAYRAAVCLQTTKNPIKLARAMLDQGASLGLDVVPNSFFATERRMSYWRKKQSEVPEHGTVGAVVLDSHGNVAAANSTGGMMLKPPGRVGDTAILGSGLYADERIAVTCSGGGESIITSMLASRVGNLYHNG
ncbi:N-terminal nucleophile aminohydrolase [Colletotrichum eremochloae]|nr:N-terminal nucleophile aminohydrolase [Colletotrichum eremochloae]